MNDTEGAAWSRPPSDALWNLFQARHFEQVISQGGRILQKEPAEQLAHYLMALARVNLSRVPEAREHVECLLSYHPDWAPSHHAASVYLRAIQRWSEARRHIETAITLDPNSPTYHLMAAVLALHEQRLDQARASVARARELDPQNPDVIRMSVEIQGLGQTTAREAWERIRELESGLEIDPNDDGLHASIGSIYLDELDQPREAEAAFRAALLNDPSDRDNQKSLFRAVGQQRMLYRLLSIPQRAYAWLANYFRGLALQPWRILLVLLAFKVVIAFVLWLAVVTVVFWPSCKVYEWLLISEIQCVVEATDRHLRFKRALNRWPFWVRFGLCVGLILGSWFVFFALLGIVTVGFAVLGGIAGVHLIFTLVLFLIRRARSSHGRWSADRGQGRRTAPPPIISPLPPPLPR